MDRRAFLRNGLALAPVLLGAAPVRAATAREPLGLVTADQEAHVVVLALRSGRVRRRIATREDPRSIERAGAGPAVVGHAGEGLITLIDVEDLRVRRVLRGFQQPRYTAIAAGGRLAYVSDSGTGELAVVDLVAGRVVRRVEVGALARHLTLSPDGRALWVALGSSAPAIAVCDLRDPRRPRVVRRVAPPFLAHDVAFSPSGRRVWVTAGRDRRLAVYAREGAAPLRVLAADDAPQHVAFGRGVAYVASGDGRSVRVHRLSDGSVRSVASVPLGSYNVAVAAGWALTPSLAVGRATILGADGRVRRSVRVARAAHDACLVV